MDILGTRNAIRGEALQWTNCNPHERQKFKGFSWCRERKGLALRQKTKIVKKLPVILFSELEYIYFHNSVSQTDNTISYIAVIFEKVLASIRYNKELYIFKFRLFSIIFYNAERQMSLDVI